MGPEPSTEPPCLLTLGADAWVSDPEVEVNRRESCFTQGSRARGRSKPRQSARGGARWGGNLNRGRRAGARAAPGAPCDCLCPSERADSRLFYFPTPWVPYAPFSLMGIASCHSFIHLFIHSFIGYRLLSGTLGRQC